MRNFLSSFGGKTFLFIMLPNAVAAYGTIWEGWLQVVAGLVFLATLLAVALIVLDAIYRFFAHDDWSRFGRAIWAILCIAPGIALYGFLHFYLAALYEPVMEEMVRAVSQG